MKKFLTISFVLAMLATASVGAPLDAREKTAQHATWRGLMIDVSRHFMPIDFLRRQVEAMSHFGLTTLHLHLTDAAGWRIEVKGYPRLTTLSAWRTAPLWKDWWNDGLRHYAEHTENNAEHLASNAEQHLANNAEHLANSTTPSSPKGRTKGQQPSAFGGFYTQDEMRSLVRYADSLGISIIPEIEFPAHSEEVTAAYPSLGCTGQPYQCADFCLGNEACYKFIDDVIGEMCSIFTAPYIHLGGDEAAGSHWLDCPRCTAKMQQLGITTRHQLQQYAMQRVATIVAQHGRRMVAWDEALPAAEDDTATIKPVIMVWRDVNTAQQAVRQGHDVVLSPGRWCYLDAYQDAPMSEPEAMGGYTPFDKVWEFARSQTDKPDNKQTNEPDNKQDNEQGRILGMQLNLWTEYVPHPQHAERMLWPRALAISPRCQAMTREEARRYVIDDALPWLRQHGISPFPLDKEVGQRREYNQPVSCLSTHCPVSYLAPYHEAYPAAGPSALTDGLRGGWTNTDGRWQGFISRQRLDVVIDLGSTHTVQTIEADFMQSLGPEIYLPQAVEIAVSTDGQNYTLLYNTRARSSNLPMDYRTFGWHATSAIIPTDVASSTTLRGETEAPTTNHPSPIAARYVRFRAMAGERGGWIFTDEIVVR